MIIGIPREIKNNEYRVGLLPVHCEALKKAGHSVIIESKAGVSADVSPGPSFNAYGITQQEDPLSQALHKLIEHAAQQERQIEQLRAALEKISPEACAEFAKDSDHLPVDQLNKMI